MVPHRTIAAAAVLALPIVGGACIDPIEFLIPIDRPDHNVWLVPWAEFLGGLVIGDASNP